MQFRRVCLRVPSTSNKDLKQDANTSICCRLYKLFSGQLVSILGGKEYFQGIYPFANPTGVPNKALFILRLMYVGKHFTIA
jgi:hypothetical protein